MKVSWVAALVLAVSLFPGVSAAPTADEFWIDIYSSGRPDYDGASGLVHYEGRDSASISWRLDLRSDYTIAEITLHRAFSTSNAWQMVPWLDLSERSGDKQPNPEIIPEIPRDVTPAEAPRATANVTFDSKETVIRVGIPGAGPARLWLKMDKTDPVVELGEPIKIKHGGFELAATSNELASATLHVRPNAWGSTQNITNFAAIGPSRVFSLVATGLEPNTTYRYWATFWDWGHNEWTSKTSTVTTAELIVIPIPELVAAYPAPDARLLGEAVAISATYATEGDVDGITATLNGRDISGQATAENGFVRLSTRDLNPGRHTITISLENEYGGTNTTSWSFTVVEPRGGTSTPGPAVALGALALLGMAAARRRF